MAVDPFMAKRRIWFGTKDLMQWVPAPKVNMQRGATGWSNKQNRLFGTTGMRKSDGTHREYQLEWALKANQTLDPIFAYANGDYGATGIHFVDPFAVNSNAMPDCYASPWKAATDGRNLAGTDAARPTISVGATTAGYPSRAATYILTGSEVPHTVWLPIPPGFTINIGAHGTNYASAFMKVLPDGGVAANLTWLSATTTTRTNYSLASTTAAGVTVYLGGTGQCDINGVIAQYTVTGGPGPAAGPWLSGQGHGSLAVTAFPTETSYSAALDLKGVILNLAEVE